MATLELILAKSPEQTSDNDRLSLFFNVLPTFTAQKILAAIRMIIQSKTPIGEPDRTYNFPGDPRDRVWIAKKLNETIDIINAYSPGLFKHRAQPVMDQSLMNELHVYFEKYRGPTLRPSSFYILAPKHIRKALEDYNTLIHRYEDYERNEQAVKEGSAPSAKICVTFEGRPRYPLDDEDYPQFTQKVDFGRWYLNYCEVGKPIWDFYQDKDEVVGEENILPLRYFSADAFIEFSPSNTDEDVKKFMADFNSWWDEKAEFLNKLGFRKGDPRNAIGHIPVADLDRERGAVAGKNEDEIRLLVGGYPLIYGVATHD